MYFRSNICTLQVSHSLQQLLLGVAQINLLGEMCLAERYTTYTTLNTLQRGCGLLCILREMCSVIRKHVILWPLLICVFQEKCIEVAES